MKIKKFNESSDFKVFIEKVASSSDFGKYIDINKDELGFDSDEFFDNIELFEEGSLSSRFDINWCKKVISGNAGDYWKNKKEYYPAILKFMEEYDLETIRFACDW